MVNRRSNKSRRGDTLVEVTIAIGIFSLVAVMVMMVVNTSISGAQTVLEGTVTREEINAQAEALRFIQAAYAADKDTEPGEISNYGNLWKLMVNGAVELSGDAAEDAAVLSYQPATCGELYGDGGIESQGAFIINVRALDAAVGEVLVFDKDINRTKFGITTSYPRIVYDYGAGLVDDGEILYSPVGNSKASVQKAEGIYVVAVKEKGGTNIVSDDGAIHKTDDLSPPAFVDFYIRTCWYTTNSEKPSTISTVIRLYNPDYTD